MQDSTVVIIGGGWAGISCAFTLAKAGINSTIIEASPQLGGRARSIKFNNYTVDNGQHLLLGAYKHTFSILQELNLPLTDLFHTTKFNITTLLNTQQSFSFSLPRIIYPLNFLVGALKISGCSWREKLRLLKFCLALKSANFALEHDMSVKDLLTQHQQTDALINYFWEPIAVAALSTPIAIASAKVFLNVIKHTFAAPATNSDLFLPKLDLSQLFPLPVVKHFPDNTKVQCNSRATAFRQLANGEFLINVNNATMRTRTLVLATPPITSCNLLKSSTILALRELADKLSNFTYETITTIYYELNADFKTKLPMYGISNNLGQWLFNRSVAAQNNIISVVITTDCAIKQLANQELTAIVFQQIKALFPTIGEFINCKVIKEKRAAFSCTVNIEKIRPENTLEVKNLYLAGDYTNTGLPATLEGATASGINCGKRIIADLLR